MIVSDKQNAVSSWPVNDSMDYFLEVLFIQPSSDDHAGYYIGMLTYSTFGTRMRSIGIQEIIIPVLLGT